MNYNICIDFGTCNTVISYVEDNMLKQIHDDITGDILVPSTLYFISSNIKNNTKISELEPDINYLIGNVATYQVNINKDYEYYFFQFKRFLGITSKSISGYNIFLKQYNLDYTTDEDIIYFYIKSTENLTSENKIKFTICDLIKLYFKALKKIIILKLPSLKNIEKIQLIITCPAYFHNLQRSQLKNAAEQAGFEVFKLINEPTAASIFYINRFINPPPSTQTKYIIYDLGGGTIDTTVVDYYPESNTCEVIDIEGNNGLGGIDIDNILCFDIIQRYHIDKSNCKLLNKVKKYAEEIKIILTTKLTHSVYLENVPVFKLDKLVWVDNLKITYSRQQFNNLINEIVDEMIQSVKNMYLKYNTSNIIFIGGPTQIPLVQSKICSILNINPQKINTIGFSNDTVWNTNWNWNGNGNGNDNTIDNILTNTENNILTNIEDNITTNTNGKSNLIYNTQDLNILYKTIVSQGGSILYKKIITKEDFCLLDIIPMNIGIADPDNNMLVMIEKNSKIPVNIERIFSTSHDCQRIIDIEIYEGLNKSCLTVQPNQTVQTNQTDQTDQTNQTEQTKRTEQTEQTDQTEQTEQTNQTDPKNQTNTFIGSYKIIGIPPLPKGMILIKLMFKISYNGILEISIVGTKNPSDNSAKSFDYKFNENIKLIPNIIAKEIFKKLLLFSEKNKL